jgi:N-acetylmuramoyl-L-alanine amidase
MEQKVVKNSRVGLIYLLSLAFFIPVLSGCSSQKQFSPELVFVPSDTPQLTVVYPRTDPPDTVLALKDTVLFQVVRDSMFILGSVNKPSWRLTANGWDVPIHENGGWLAWIPVEDTIRLDSSSVYGPGREARVTLELFSPSNKKTLERSFYLVEQENVDPEVDDSTFTDTSASLVVISPTAKIRVGWPGTNNMYPEIGTILSGEGFKGESRKLWKVKLGESKIGWIEDSYVEVDSLLLPPPVQVVHKVLCQSDERITKIKIPLEEKLPFLIERENDNQISLTLFGAVSWTDIIIQPYGSRVVDEVRWSQPGEETYKVVANIHEEWFWGWDVDYDVDNNLVWTIIESPAIKSKPLSGLKVVVDPGHGEWNYSAIGPTGFPEKTANLLLSEEVIKQLNKAGADVVTTRTDDSFIGLLDRILFSKAENADLLISLHHNALPQGKNPFTHHGSSLHYYQRQSKPLADALYSELSKDGWYGDGVKYQDLALSRPSFLPAILVEAGFMVHPEEEDRFKYRKHHRMIAKRLVRGLEKYLLDMRERQSDK